jgi:hypothetical protein
MTRAVIVQHGPDNPLWWTLQWALVYYHMRYNGVRY